MYGLCPYKMYCPVEKRGVEGRKRFLNVLLVIMAQPPCVCRLLVLEMLWDSLAVTHQERGLSTEPLIIYKELTKTKSLSAAELVLHECNMLFVLAHKHHCLAVAQAEAALAVRPGFVGSSSTVSSLLILLQGCVWLFLIRTIWIVLTHAKLLCKTGPLRLIYFFIFSFLELLRAHCCNWLRWAFGSLSTSESQAHCI